MCCPICRREAFAEGNPFRPFCSERCKLIDLDNWLAGRYRISTSAERQEKIESLAGFEEIANESSESGE
jgi:endogenous inhibitor of DNA gyrase (YacG/DUF329 family)